MVRLRRHLHFLLIPFLLLAPGCASVDLSAVGDLLSQADPLDEPTVAAGLREALDVGTQRAVGTLSAEGGFGQNAALRLVIPDELNTMASRLRTVGLGDQVDRFEEQMNSAAETAASEAVGVFAGAIRQMTIQDAFGILRGPEDAATVYFRSRTEAELTSMFSPVVDRVMSELGVVRVYNDLVTRYNAIPLVQEVSYDLSGYVVDRTLDGLFQTLAEEELRIRVDPVARTTQLLQRVFSEVSQ